MHFSTRSLLAGLLLLAGFVSHAGNNAAFEQRRTDYISTALANLNGDAITIQAYQGLPVDTTVLNNLIVNLPNKGTADFDVVKLVRVLFLSNGQYDAKILPALQQLPFWLTKGDTLRGYWSENHMIQWMSSDWLLREKYNWGVDTNLHKRLLHYLHMKIDYGFYEFHSSVYAPYSFSGLVNLADFAEDTVIKTLAIEASQRLLKDMLMFTNDQGTYFPVAGRNYYGKYETPYGQNHNSLIWLLTGFGQAPNNSSHAGGFLATSTLLIDTVVSTWQAQLDTTYHIGHTIDSGLIIHGALRPLDKTMMMWSSGGYFHPIMAQESATLLNDSALWHHIDFTDFVGFSVFPVSTIVSLSNSLSVASKSTVNSGQDIVLFKHNSVTLGSIKNFWPGKLGFQQMPCVANVGRTAVMTGSGPVIVPWHDRKENNANEHLPYVKQHKNVALIMYRPEFKPALLPYNNDEVALFFNENDFDEVRNDSLWILGRQDENYVAVRRHCMGQINGEDGCYMDRGQTWVIMVGDSGMYTSFNNFESLIQQSQFEESWYLDSAVEKHFYYAKITVDTTTIDYAWGVDSLLGTGLTDLNFGPNQLKLYPNPATDRIEVDLSAFLNKDVQLKVINAIGAEVYAENMRVYSNSPKPIYLLQLPAGVYTVSVQADGERYVSRLIKE